jgi:hypothetical protein
VGFAGGCPTCAVTHARACIAEQLWHTKAKALNLPLSAGKGHSVNQGGPFTGVAIDTFTNQYNMLPDKLQGLHENFNSMTPLLTSSPRALARSRGKAFHYGCAIQYLRIPCASLTQAIHQTEALGSAPPPSLEAEKDNPDFNWDQTLPVTTRTRTTLASMQLILQHFGQAGQPLWPPPSASLYGAFLAKIPSEIPTAVLTAFALPAGWGFSLRFQPSLLALTGTGTWLAAHCLLDAPWMSPGLSLPSSAPASPSQQHALACLLSLHEASRHCDLSRYQLLVRCASEDALGALCKGAPHCPALQDIAMLFLSACVHLHLRQPLFLSSPHGQSLRPTPPNASTLALLDSATPTLRKLVRLLALRVGHKITLDLFATRCNTITPRFYSAWTEPEAEAQDAMSQTDWGQSLCPLCQKLRPDFVFLYPPFGLVPAALRKAQYDQAQGILVVPYATTAPWWPTILRISRTDHRLHPTRIPCSPTYVDNQSNPAGHYITILHFDFWQGTSPRSRSCPHGHLARGSASSCPGPDQPDLDLITAALITAP